MNEFCFHVFPPPGIRFYLFLSKRISALPRPQRYGRTNHCTPHMGLICPIIAIRFDNILKRIPFNGAFYKPQQMRYKQLIDRYMAANQNWRRLWNWALFGQSGGEGY